MKKFSRKIEKTLAWIANVIMLIITATVGIIAFSGYTQDIINNPEFKNEFEKSIAQSGYDVSNYGTDVILGAIKPILITYSVILIITFLVALVATLTMKKRILSAILFLISVVLSFITTFYILIPSIIYLLVAILMLVRKEKITEVEDNDNNDEDNTKIERIEYI